MPNNYINPFNSTNNTVGIGAMASAASVNTINASIMANNSSSTMNYVLSLSDLKEDDIELIKKELERKIQEQKDDLQNKKETRGILTFLGNGFVGLFGGGDKKVEKKIANYEALLASLDSDISNIDEVYKTIIGSDLDLASLQSLKGSEALANSIDSETQEAIVAELENQLAALESGFETAQNSNGWISGSWNWFKNWTGLGASSNKTTAEINDLKEQIEKLKNGEADLATTFKNIAGADLNINNLSSLLSGEEGTGLDSISSAGQSVNAYSEGQKMCTDVVGDIVSGIAAVGVVAFGTAIGICAAPFTAGASLSMVAASMGLAAGTGALVKTAIKALDCIGNEKKYGWKDLGYDLITGSINGAAAPLTNALGGAAGTTVMKLFDQEALETTVKSGALLAAKEVAKEVFEEGVEQAGKKLVSTGLAKVASFTANNMVDGGLSGFIDGSSRALAEGRYEDILSDGMEGLKGGLRASPIIGTGFNLAGKAGSRLGQSVFGEVASKVISKGTQALGGVIDNMLPQGVKRIIQESSEKLNNRFMQTSLKNCLTISDDGIYSVKTNGYSVQLIESELSEEILEAISKGDNTLIFNYANEVLAQELSENILKNLSSDITQKLLSLNCNVEDLTKIKELEAKQLKVFETCLKDGNVEVLLRDGILKIDDIIDLNYYMNVSGFGEIPIPAGKKQARQFIKALKDENILNLLKNDSINIKDVMKIVDYTGSSLLRGYSFNEALKVLQDDKVIKLISSGLDINSAVHATNLTDVQIESFYSVIENSNLDFDVHIVKLQNNAGYEIKAKTKNYIDDEFQTEIQFEYSIGANGEQRCARIEDYGIADGVMTRYKNSDNSILLREYDKKGKLDESIELISNNDGEPIAIVHTKVDTENLQGVYKTVKYNLSDYPEDIDIIEAIKSGKISGGEILTETIKNNDGSVTYKERYNVDNIETSRAYTQKLNESGEMLSSQYQYQIIDKNGGSLMQIERSWIKNSDGSTTTTINGKKYIANFDDASKTISITHENGQTTTIDLSKKQVGETLSKILALIGRKPDISTAGQEELWEFYKTLPVDSLINLDKYIKKIGKVDNLESTYFDIVHILTTGTEISVLNHELGHSIDFSNKKQFSKNQKLIDLYNEEMTSFKNNAPPEMQSIISYFSQNGSSHGAFNIQGGDTGLNEFIAEVNSLLTTYGHETDSISARAMYLTRYFPKTIAKIAELLGYSN